MWWTLALKWWKEITVVVLILSGFLYVRWLHSSRAYWKAQYGEVYATLSTERAGHQKAMDDALDQRQRDLALANEIHQAAVQHLQTRIHSISDNAIALRDRLRIVEANRIRPLAPAASAPAECRDYESDPTRLSREAREFLVWEAAAAETLGEYLDACRKDYKVVRKACGIPD
jgi:hypothetical protein